MARRGNSFGRIKNLFGGNKNNNGKDYDVMNPEATNPDVKKAANRIGDLTKKIAKKIAKYARKLLSLLIKFWPLGLVVLVLLILVAFQHMPGMMKNKLLDLFKIDPSKWLMNGAAANLDNNKIIDVANYLEEMGYSLVGDGFVTPVLRTANDSIFSIAETLNQHPEYEYKADENNIGHFYYKDTDVIVSELTFYDYLGQTVNNETGLVENGEIYTDEFGIRREIPKEEEDSSSTRSRGQLANLDGLKKEEAKEYLKNYSLIRTYLLSNYRIYTLRNNDEDMLTNIYNALATISGNEDAWAKGLIKLYNAKGGWATGHWWWGRGLLGEKASIDSTTLTLKKGWFNNPMDFPIEGWAPRYGMSLEFLLSLHLGTHAPDLAKAMIQNFDTEVQVYLDDSGKATVNSRYVDPNSNISGITPGSGDSLDKVKAVLRNAGRGDIISDTAGWEAFNGLLDKTACQILLRSDELTLHSPDTCTGTGQMYYIETSTYEISNFLGLDTSTNSLQTYGITEELDADVYEKVSEYPNTNFTKDDGKNLEFTAEHITKNIGAKDSNYENDDYTCFADTAQNLKFDISKMANPTTSEFDKVLVSNHSNPNVQTEDHKRTTVIDRGNVYRIKKVINDNTWSAETRGTVEDAEPEEVEYNWVSYKYLIYQVGTYEREADQYDEKRKTNYVGGTPSYEYTYTVDSWKDAAISYLDTEKWVNTVVVEFIAREKTTAELIANEILLDLDGDGIYETVNLENNKCSEDENKDKCCSACQKYVRAAVMAMSTVSNQTYQSYTPYIARVVGSWFRDTYFIIPDDYKYEDEDGKIVYEAGIREYAGTIIDDEGNNNKAREYIDENGERQKENIASSTEHPEFNVANAYGENATFVKVDEQYLEDTGEYWTAYEMNGEDYQLYVLNGDGTTSNTKLEDFINTGMIDGVQASVNKVLVQPGQYGETTSKEAIQEAKENAEKDGWAFVKKAQVQKVQRNAGNYGEADKIDDHILWSTYGFDSKGKSTEWKKVTRADGNKDVNKLYEIIYGQDSDGDDEVSGIFYQVITTNNVTQVEDAQRGETNPLVKYLFKYRKFYIYDGSESRGLAIEHDKQRVLYGYADYQNQKYDFENLYYNDKVLVDSNQFKETDFGNTLIDKNFYHYVGLLDRNNIDTGGLLYTIYGDNWKKKVIDLLNKYGRSALRQSYSFLTVGEKIDPEDLANQWLDWQLDMYYMNKYKVDLYQYYHTSAAEVQSLCGIDDLLVLQYDPRDPDIIGTVEITKSSLNVFSILENAGTLDAEYAYRDFKELIVELDFFDKEDLSDKIPSIFTWILPEEENPVGWPVRKYDKENLEYGTLIHSKATYDALDAYTQQVAGDSEETQTSRYEGYEAGELVASPVTGKILEVGTHDRMNIYTGKMETVDYIVIEAMDSKEYFKSYMFDKNQFGYETETTYQNVEDALNLFYDEYKGVCEGYTIMIDGIDVDLSLTDGTEENKAGAYTQNKPKSLYNSGEYEIRLAKEQAKDDAPFFVKYGESAAYPKPEDHYQATSGIVGYYVKEGKYIGRTIENAVATTTKVTSEISGETVSKLTVDYADYAGPADYIRIIIKDRNYSIVDNVEDFFNTSASATTGSLSSQPFTGEYSEEFLYWMLVLCEGLSHQEVVQGYSVAKDIGDGTITAAMGVTNYCNDYFWNLGYSDYVHGIHASNSGMKVGDQIPIEVLRDVAIAELDHNVEQVKNTFPGKEFDEYQMASLLSVTYNFGSIPNKLKEAINSGDTATIRSTWEHLSDSQASKYPGLPKRRKAEATIFLDKKWVGTSAVDLRFSSTQPFTDYLRGNFNVASE